jgi:hypothetical protein
LGNFSHLGKFWIFHFPTKLFSHRFFYSLSFRLNEGKKLYIWRDMKKKPQHISKTKAKPITTTICSDLIWNSLFVSEEAVRHFSIELCFLVFPILEFHENGSLLYIASFIYDVWCVWDQRRVTFEMIIHCKIHFSQKCHIYNQRFLPPYHREEKRIILKPSSTSNLTHSFQFITTFSLQISYESIIWFSKHLSSIFHFLVFNDLFCAFCLLLTNKTKKKE